MIARKLFFLFLNFFIISGRPIQEQLPKLYSIRNSQGISKEVTIVNGKSIFFTFQEKCKEIEISKEDCIQISSRVSIDYYSVFYSPTRQTSTIEDFYAERTDILKYLRNRFNHTSYLEIGCQSDINFNKMKDLFDVYVGVDPSRGGTVRMTSDEFFRQNQQKFDLIFIDGDHKSEQVWKDIVNSLSSLNEGGSVVLHDLNPLLHEWQIPVDDIEPNMIWNGDGWKAAVAMRLASDYEIIVVDVDHGCGIIRKRPNTHPLPESWHNVLIQIPPLPGTTLPATHSLTFDDFDSNRETLYRLMTMVEMREWLESE